MLEVVSDDRSSRRKHKIAYGEEYAVETLLKDNPDTSVLRAPEEVGHAFINVRGHVPFAALYYIPRCIPACN